MANCVGSLIMITVITPTQHQHQHQHLVIKITISLSVKTIMTTDILSQDRQTLRRVEN